MILPFIIDSLTKDPEPENITQAGEKSDVKFLAEGSDNNSADSLSREDSFEKRYKALLDKIEKERFERELLAGNS